MMLMLKILMLKMLMPLAGRPTIRWTHLASEPEPTKFRVQSHKTSKLSFQNQIQTTQRRQSQQRWVFECFWRLCIFVGNCLVSKFLETRERTVSEEEAQYSKCYQFFWTLDFRFNKLFKTVGIWALLFDDHQPKASICLSKARSPA